MLAHSAGRVYPEDGADARDYFEKTVQSALSTVSGRKAGSVHDGQSSVDHGCLRPRLAPWHVARRDPRPDAGGELERKSRNELSFFAIYVIGFLLARASLARATRMRSNKSAGGVERRVRGGKVLLRCGPVRCRVSA
jgi:hypothetical protein